MLSSPSHTQILTSYKGLSSFSPHHRPLCLCDQRRIPSWRQFAIACYLQFDQTSYYNLAPPVNTSQYVHFHRRHRHQRGTVEVSSDKEYLVAKIKRKGKTSHRYHLGKAHRRHPTTDTRDSPISCLGLHRRNSTIVDSRNVYFIYRSSLHRWFRPQRPTRTPLFTPGTASICKQNHLRHPDTETSLWTLHQPLFALEASALLPVKRQ